MIGELLERWRSEAELFRRRGLSREADLIESLAAEAEAWRRAHGMKLLTLSEAADETGLAYDTLQRKVSRGEIPNRGRRHSPRVRRADLHSDAELIARLANS